MERKRLYLATIDPSAHVLAKRYGLGLEISEYCTAYNMDEHFGEVDALVREKVKCTDRFVLHAPFNELFPCAIDPKARALAAYRYRQAIRLAKEYGAAKVVIHGGYNPWIYYPVWYTEQSVVFWKEFLKEDPGLELVLENVLEEGPELLLDIVKGVNDPRLRLCLDVGHVNAYSGIPVEEWVKAWAPWLSHFHIHNNDGSRDSHSPLDCGSIRIKEVLRLAETLCPEATCTLELTDGTSSVRWLLEE